MKRKLAIAAASACLLAASTVQANLVLNPGFETGTGAPQSTGVPWWGNFGDVPYTAAGAHSGNQGAQLGTALGTRAISQSFALLPGQEYLLEFWAREAVSGLSFLTVVIDGAYVLISADILTDTWTKYSYNVTTTGPGDLTFNNSAGLRVIYLDDVSLTAVPEPATVIAGALLLVPLSMSTMRMLRRRMTT